MRSRFVAAAAASVVAVGGLTAIYLDAEHGGESSLGAASGQELFRAVVFGQGELAKQLGSRPALSAFYEAGYIENNAPSQISAADQVVKSIEAEDPAYFAGFAEALRSGNPYVVSHAVAGVEPELQRVGLRSDTPTVPGSAASRPAPSPRSPKNTKSVNVNYQFNFNVHTNINVAINENVAFNLNYFKARTAAFSDPFQHDVMIGELASLLKI